MSSTNHGHTWQLTSSCQPVLKTSGLTTCMTLSLVFERGRELNKDEESTRRKRTMMSQVTLIVPYISIYLGFPRREPADPRTYSSHLGFVSRKERKGKEKMGCQAKLSYCFLFSHHPSLPFLHTQP